MFFLALIFFFLALVSFLLMNVMGVFIFLVLGTIFTSLSNSNSRSKDNLKKAELRHQELVETIKTSPTPAIDSEQHIAWMKEQIAKHEAKAEYNNNPRVVNGWVNPDA